VRAGQVDLAYLAYRRYIRQLLRQRLPICEGMGRRTDEYVPSALALVAPSHDREVIGVAYRREA
jgi:hypothetical protein